MSSPGSRRSYLAALGAGIAVIAASTYGVSLTQAAQSTAAAAPPAAVASVVGSIPAPSPVPDPSASTGPSSTSSAAAVPSVPEAASVSAAPTRTTSSAGRSSSAPSSRPSGTSAGVAPATKSPVPSAPAPTTAPVPTTEPAPVTTAAAAPASQYKDGTYTATAEYNSPGGVEKVGVTVTLVADVVTGSSIEKLGGVGIAQTYQSLFEKSYAPMVTGKKIDTIKLGAVGGSSLTSGGFNAALEAIEGQARA